MSHHQNNQPEGDQGTEKQAIRPGDKAPAGTAITSKDDNRIQQLQEKREALATDRLTKDPNNGLKIDMGNGKVVEDKRPVKAAEQAYRDSGYGDPDKLLGQAKQPVEQAKAGAVVEKVAKLDEPPGQKLEAPPIPKPEQKAGAEAAARQLFSQGSLYADGVPRRPDDVIAQVRPSKEATHEAVMTAQGVGLGVVNFTEKTITGVVDTVRMLNAANMEAHPFKALLPDLDPEGTKKLHETCQGLAMGSRVLLQYTTTLNEGSPFYRKDFDPEARQAAEKLAQAMPEKLKDEINQYRNSDTQTKAAKSTELALDIYTCAETGGLAVAKAGQIAKESKILSQISTDMIDARNQPNMTEALAEKGMRDALKETRLLKEIRIVGKDFDISLKAGRQEKVKRW